MRNLHKQLHYDVQKKCQKRVFGIPPEEVRIVVTNISLVRWLTEHYLTKKFFRHFVVTWFYGCDIYGPYTGLQACPFIFDIDIYYLLEFILVETVDDPFPIGLMGIGDAESL